MEMEAPELCSYFMQVSSLKTSRINLITIERRVCIVQRKYATYFNTLTVAFLLSENVKGQ